MTELRVVVADDSPLFRTLLVDSLRTRGLDVVGEAHDLPSAVALVEQRNPDLAILDIRMPPTGTNEGLVAAGIIRAKGPAVLLLSQYVEATTAHDVIEASNGSIGYLLKDRVADADVLVAQVRRICAGEVVLDPEVVSRLFGRTRRDDPLDRLTPTQRSVLELVAEGRSNKGIAQQLHISERTVESHISVIFDLLGLERTPEVHRRVAAAITFLRGDVN